eukprot:7804612-Karenia_brevis.AAC.1
MRILKGDSKRGQCLSNKGQRAQPKRGHLHQYQAEFTAASSGVVEGIAMVVDDDVTPSFAEEQK